MRRPPTQANVPPRLDCARAAGRVWTGFVLPRASRHEGNNFTSVMRPTAERTPQSLTRDFSLGGIEAEEGEREGGGGERITFSRLAL